MDATKQVSLYIRASSPPHEDDDMNLLCPVFVPDIIGDDPLPFPAGILSPETLFYSEFLAAGGAPENAEKSWKQQDKSRADPDIQRDQNAARRALLIAGRMPISGVSKVDGFTFLPRARWSPGAWRLAASVTDEHFDVDHKFTAAHDEDFLTAIKEENTASNCGIYTLVISSESMTTITVVNKSATTFIFVGLNDHGKNEHVEHLPLHCHALRNSIQGCSQVTVQVNHDPAMDRSINLFWTWLKATTTYTEETGMKLLVSSSFSAGEYSLSWLLDKLWQKLNPTNEDTPVMNELKAENPSTQGLTQLMAHPPQSDAIKEERSVSPAIQTQNLEVGDVKAEPTSKVDSNTQDGTPHPRAPDSYEGFNV